MKVKQTALKVKQTALKVQGSGLPGFKKSDYHKSRGR
jgi:hypothetical protein